MASSTPDPSFASSLAKLTAEKGLEQATENDLQHLIRRIADADTQATRDRLHGHYINLATDRVRTDRTVPHNNIIRQIRRLSRNVPTRISAHQDCVVTADVVYAVQELINS